MKSSFLAPMLQTGELSYNILNFDTYGRFSDGYGYGDSDTTEWASQFSSQVRDTLDPLFTYRFSKP
ncbi:hypothetical protein AMATHDRAFT_60862 [Amanita thiersii Skay4041]|uniref:Uncharacterized protein n=1 Tax=Amanita thiersii Skay4041 TaxID=703135 RepID=A0A2A9NSB2_9AGAR|nr:hypothetical protein AMATHDRAFT_60862 [Amanita thiersii Skay4041]